MKKLAFVFAAFLLCCGIVFAAEGKTLKSVPAPFTRGVNFSEWLEFKDKDQLDATYMTKVDFENAKKMGCDVVRLPVHFERLTAGAPGYAVAEEIWSILDDVVVWANELKIYVIIDFHNDTSGGTKTPVNIETILVNIWKQISARYKNSGKYIAYEVYNEPHGIDKFRWAKVAESVVNEIRKIDSQHYIIVGGADWNSFDAMKILPKFNDDKIIYNFHFYEPMLFTHQGASWNGMGRLQNIPFPYDKDRMPKIPQNPTKDETWYYSKGYNYEYKGTEAAVAEFFDQYAQFSIERNAPVFCGEFGVYNVYADPAERTNWYRIVTKLLDERGIAHTSWDYYGSFGVFKKGSGDLFPQDLERSVVEAMNLKVPEGREATWGETAFKNKDFTIYDNGFVRGLKCSSWGSVINKAKNYNKEKVIQINSMNAYSAFEISFKESVDFTELKKDGYCIEFMAQSEEPDLNMSVWLQNSGVKTEYEWRANFGLNKNQLPADGKWHKISVPLSGLGDIGAYDNKTSSWINGRGKFDWSDIFKFVIANNGIELKKSVIIKDIKFVKN